jgi:hypothetical protein
VENLHLVSRVNILRFDCVILLTAFKLQVIYRMFQQTVYHKHTLRIDVTCFYGLKFSKCCLIFNKTLESGDFILGVINLPAQGYLFSCRDALRRMMCLLCALATRVAGG